MSIFTRLISVRGIPGKVSENWKTLVKHAKSRDFLPPGRCNSPYFDPGSLLYVQWAWTGIYYSAVITRYAPEQHVRTIMRKTLRHQLLVEFITISLTHEFESYHFRHYTQDKPSERDRGSFIILKSVTYTLHVLLEIPRAVISVCT